MSIKLPAHIEAQLRQAAYEAEKQAREHRKRLEQATGLDWCLQVYERQCLDLLARAGIDPNDKTISPEEWAKTKLDEEEALRTHQEQRREQAAEAGRVGGKSKAVGYVDRDEWIFSQYQALSPDRNDWANVIRNRMDRDTTWPPITTRRITQIVTRMKKSEI